MSGRRLRIAFVSVTMYSGIGGGVMSGAHFVERLREQHDVTVVACDAPGRADVRVPGFQLPIPAMQRMRFTMAWPSRRLCAQAVQNADVVHLQFPFWLSFVALNEAKEAGKKVVAAFHVQPENIYSNIGIRSDWLNHKTYGFVTERFFNRADAVVCPTRFAERKLQEYGLTAPSHVVTNGVPPDMLSGNFTRDSRFEGRVLVLSVGRHAPEKRHDLVIEAVSRSRHRERIQLVIAGAGPLSSELELLGSRLPNPAIVGYLPREELRRYFFTADLCVHASEVELEGISVVEAMSAGLPVLVAAGSQSAAADFALNDAFRFPAGDVIALTNKLDALIEAPDMLSRARTEYRAKARSLDFGDSVERLVSIYRSVLGEPGVHSRHVASG